MRQSILRDLTPSWFARQSPDVRCFIWTCCLSASDRQELWRGLARADKQRLLAALHIGIAPSVTIHVE
jgi:hypothetical protein